MLPTREILQPARRERALAVATGGLTVAAALAAARGLRARCAP